MVDIQLLKNIAERLYIPLVTQEHGPEGEVALQKIMEVLHKIYRYIEPEVYKDSIVVFKPLKDDARLIPKKGAITIADPSVLPLTVKGAITIQVLDNGQMLLWNRKTPDVKKLAKKAVVYLYKNYTEFFLANDIKSAVPKINAAYASMFSIPTFSDLKTALEHYRVKMARYSSCKILSEAWFDDNRIFLKNAQEWVMRNSLTQFLKCHLRGDLEVRPEQIVDESHPVDIKVTWWSTNRLALIEIKWLGTPKYKAHRIGTPYGDSRANKGAKQLADYLDENNRQAPTHITIGYLVVIDARRAGLKPTTKTIDAIKGLHYKHKEIKFEPEYHEKRSDFATPIRMFVEPNCT